MKSKPYIEKANLWRQLILQEKKPQEVSDADQKDFEEVKSGEYEDWRKNMLPHFDKEQSWQHIEDVISPSLPSPKTYHLFKYMNRIAAVFLLAFSVAGAYLLLDEVQKVEQKFEVKPGSSVAYLEVDNQQVIELNQKDTLLNLQDNKLELNAGKIRYSQKQEVKQKSQYHKINVPRNAEYFIHLSDGTKVWINSASSIGFQSQFDDQKRIVSLEGEAYFEVAKDAQRPFYVKTKGMMIRVLGTHFNVKAYQNEEYTYATLNEGSIQVISGRQKEILQPNNQLIFNKQNQEMHKRKVNASIYSAWTKNKFVYKDEPLENILNDLGRWYDLKIFYERKEVKNIRFSMSVNRYADVNLFLNHLKLMGGVDFELKEKIVIVK